MVVNAAAIFDNKTFKFILLLPATLIVCIIKDERTISTVRKFCKFA